MRSGMTLHWLFFKLKKKKITAETEITFEELWSKTLNIISISVTLKCEKFQPTKYSVLVYKIYETN